MHTGRGILMIHVTYSMFRPLRHVKRPFMRAALSRSYINIRSGGRRFATFPSNSIAVWLGASTSSILFFSYMVDSSSSRKSLSNNEEYFVSTTIRELHHRIIGIVTQNPKMVRCDAVVNEPQLPETSVTHYSEMYDADLDDDSSGYTEEDRFYECVTYHRSLLHDYLRRWGPRPYQLEDETAKDSDETATTSSETSSDDGNSSTIETTEAHRQVSAQSKSRWPRNIPTAQEVTALECDLVFCERNPKLEAKGNDKACQETKFQIAAYYVSRQNDDRVSQREKGFLVIKELAEQGYADAMCYYGNLLSEGTIDGVESNPQQAVVWWRRCVDEHSHINAMYEFATACYLGDGIPENAAMAVSLFRRAAHLGHAGAAYMLGECLLNGVGAERDRSDALEWLVTAAELGHLGAQDRVLMILNRDYGMHDETEAARLRQQQETLKWLNYEDQDSHAKVVNIERRFTIGGGSRNPVVVARRKSIVEESRNDQ